MAFQILWIPLLHIDEIIRMLRYLCVYVCTCLYIIIMCIHTCTFTIYLCTNGHMNIHKYVIFTLSLKRIDEIAINQVIKNKLLLQ